MDTTVTHLMSFFIVADGRVIQRCAICGEKIIDAYPSRCAVPEGMDNTFPTWPVGALLRVQGENPKHFTNLGDAKETRWPTDICVSLVEESP